MSSRKRDLEDSDDSDRDDDRDRKKRKRHRHSRSRSRSVDRKRRSRSRSPKRLKRKKSSAWDDTVGKSNPDPGAAGAGSSILAPVLHVSSMAVPSSSAQVGSAAFLTSAATQALARVYVGNIYFEIDENDIKQVFERCGAVRAVQMTRDAGDKQHKGFCFIEFEAPDSAETAVQTMNGFQLAGRSLRVGRPHNPASSMQGMTVSAPALQPILLPQRDEVAEQYGLPAIKGSKLGKPGDQNPPSGYPLRGGAKIYIANLTADATESSVSDFCNSYGHVKCVKLEALDNGTKFSLVEFDDDSEAERAVKKLHGHKLQGARVQVGRVLPAAAAQNTLVYQQVQQVAQMRQAGLPTPSNYGINQMSNSDTSAHNPNENLTSNESMHITSGSARVALMQKLMRKEDGDPQKAIPRPAGVVLSGEDPGARSLTAAAPPMAQQMLGQPNASGEVSTPTRCVVLKNLVGSPKEVDDELGVEVKEECSKYGPVEHLLIFDEENPVTRQVEVKFFILYATLQGAMKAVERLNNRFFAKRRIACKYYHEALFRKLLAE